VVGGKVSVALRILVVGSGVLVSHICPAVWTTVVTRSNPAIDTVAVLGCTIREQAWDTTSQTKFVTLGGMPLIVQAVAFVELDDILFTARLSGAELGVGVGAGLGAGVGVGIGVGVGVGYEEQMPLRQCCM
jgi:hypothetical protein